MEALLRDPPLDADVYVEDEVQLSLHPTLTRLWMRRGRGAQRCIPAPGTNRRRPLFGATDWRDGAVVRRYSPHRDSQTFAALAGDCVQRSAQRDRRAVLVIDNARIHTPEGARAVREVQERHGERLQLVYLPAYAPDLQPQEQLWRDWRHHVTHNHQRSTLDELQADSERYFLEREPASILQTIGSPFTVKTAMQHDLALVI